MLAFAPSLRNTAEVNTTVTELTDQLIASYARVGGINHIDGVNLPSKTAIGLITIDLLKLLFPGFFDEKSIHSSEIKTETANLMDVVLGRLDDEICKSLKSSPQFTTNKRDPRNAARNLTVDFLRKLPNLREILQTDIEAAYRGDPAALNKEEIIVAYPFDRTRIRLWRLCP